MPASELPLPATPFVGRSDELAEIASLLATPACRLLTLTGAGGMGKTRLALETAHRMAADATKLHAPFSDGIFFVPLQPVTSPELIVSAVANVFKVTFFGEQDTKGQLLDTLRGKNLLLVLDNFEHLMPGAELLSEIVSAAEQVKVLVTSRERLHLREEWVLEVGGLPFPAADAHGAQADYTAMQLFTDSARRAGYVTRPADAPFVTRICQLVEGIPLALELAASWTRAISCAEIAQEIERSLDILTTPVRNMPEKHRSMRAAFEHSWRLLPEDEQAVFRKLSVFHGRFQRKAAEQVAGASLPTLAALVDRSMLRRDANGRYSLHEILRQYGTERLEESAEEATQAYANHCRYYTHFMERQWPRLTGSELKAALDEINAELDNVRAAWEWGVSHHMADEIEVARRSMWFFYGVSVHYQEGEQVFGRSIEAFKDDEVLHPKLMARWGELCGIAGLVDKAFNILETSLKLLREIDAQEDIAFVLYRLALIDMDFVMNLPKVATYLEESLAIYATLDNHFGMGEVLYAWGQYYWTEYAEKGFEGSLQRAQQCIQECLIAYRQHDSVFGITITHMGLSTVAALEGEYRQALEHAQISRVAFRKLGIGWGIMQSLIQVGSNAYMVGDYAETRQCVLESLRFNSEHGLSRRQYGNSYIIQIVLVSLHLEASILIDEGNKERGYELLAVIDQESRNFESAKPQEAFPLLALLTPDLPPKLATAVQRGRTLELDTLVKELIADLSRHTDQPGVLPVAEAPPAQDELLTERELEILRLVADGLNSRETALRLHLGVNTIRWYLRQIYSKLDVHSRSEAIARARVIRLLV